VALRGGPQNIGNQYFQVTRNRSLGWDEYFPSARSFRKLSRTFDEFWNRLGDSGRSAVRAAWGSKARKATAGGMTTRRCSRGRSLAGSVRPKLPCRGACSVVYDSPDKKQGGELPGSGCLDRPEVEKIDRERVHQRCCSAQRQSWYRARMREGVGELRG